MITNLMHNAVVHNLAAGGSVRVRTSAGSDEVVLTVENTGEPVGAELASTLVEPFQRGTQRIRGDHAGVGLGLAIVQSIVRAHDGALTIDARPEGGLRVTAELPRSVSSGAGTGAAQAGSGPAREPLGDAGRGS
ncbi:sensor histidine kinase [Leucobacter sp.]